MADSKWKIHSNANMKSASLIVLAVFAVLASAKSVYEPRIVNGEDAKEGQFPYVASLRNKITGRHYCGASILSARFLLTAGHCCTGNNGSPENVFAMVGTIRQSSGGIVVEVDKITPHKEFVLDGIYKDICLIRTAEEITFTDNIQPIALPKENLSENTSHRAVLSGWGRHKVKSFLIIVQTFAWILTLNVILHSISFVQYPSFAVPDVLQYYEIKTLNNNKCAKSFPEDLPLREWVRENNVCTVNTVNGGACHGDSGKNLLKLFTPKTF